MKKKAFTLIELLVVIAIIGLLSTIAVVSLVNTRNKSRDTKRAADIRQIVSALQLYYDDIGTYPNPGTLGCAAGAGGLYCLGHGSSDTCWAGALVGCTELDEALEPYISKIPDDPLNDTASFGDAYIYQYSGTMVTVTAPLLHWGLDGTGSTEACLNGYLGQWGAPGNNKWYCILALP